MIYSIFDKTIKGREEIATRKHQLPSRLRALLLLFDGKRTTEEVLQKVTGIGLTEQNIQELLQCGFIQHGDNISTAASLPPSSEPVAVAAFAHHPAPTIEPVRLADGETLLQALYNFYTETIRSAIGLRGYALQIKVERARSIEDFRNMRQDYLSAVEKAQGAEAARNLDSRLQQLLQMESSMTSKDL